MSYVECRGELLAKDAIGHISRITRKSALDSVCNIVGSCNHVARVNVGVEVTSRFVTEYSPHHCASVLQVIMCL